MKIMMNLYGQLGRMAKANAQACECPEGASINEVLERVLETCEPAAREIVFDGAGQVRPSLIVLVNGVPVGKEKPCGLKDGDQVTLLPAIAGG